MEETVVTVPQGKVTKVQEAVASKGKTRKIMAVKNHKCKIGGTQYILEKSKDYTVPEDVANILAEAQIVIIK